MLRSSLRTNWLILVVLAFGTQAFAVPISPVIDVGDHLLLPNTPGQQIQIGVTSDILIEGCNLNAQIGDGGPEASGTPAPVITLVDLENGIFAGNNDGQWDLGSIPQLAMYSINTNSGGVFADGLLVTLTIDTTGFTFPGSWPLQLQSTLNGSSDFATMPAEIIDGSITLVPEPATMSLIGLGGLTLLRRRKK